MKKFSLQLWLDFFSELAWLVRHGIPLQSAFHLLLKQHRLKRMHRFLYHCLDQLSMGHPFSHALHDHPQQHLFQAFVYCGETAGALDDALQQCAAWIAQTLHFHTQCRALLFYPLLLCALLVAGSVLMMSTIVPEFYALYQAFHAPLPTTLQLLWQTHIFLAQWGIWLAIGIVIGGCVITMTCFSAICSRLPFVKQLMHAHECAHLGALLSGGIPLFQAFQILIRQTRFTVHRDALTRLLEHMMQGRPLAMAYQVVGWHDPYLCDLLRIAETTGTLDETYVKLSVYYTQQLDTRIQRFKQEWQPLLLLAMGGLVGTWVFLLYYPLIQLGYAVG